jgi:hypothetical protein
MRGGAESSASVHPTLEEPLSGSSNLIEPVDPTVFELGPAVDSIVAPLPPGSSTALGAMPGPDLNLPFVEGGKIDQIVLRADHR